MSWTLTGSIRLLRRDVETGKQPDRFVEVEVVNVRPTFFVKEPESEQTQESTLSWDHLRARITGPTHQLIELHTRQQQKLSPFVIARQRDAPGRSAGVEPTGQRFG